MPHSSINIENAKLHPHSSPQHVLKRAEAHVISSLHSWCFAMTREQEDMKKHTRYVERGHGNSASISTVHLHKSCNPGTCPSSADYCYLRRNEQEHLTR